MSELRKAVEAVIEALDLPRDRLGRLTAGPASVAGEALRRLAVEYDVGGCKDRIEQAVRVLKAALAAGTISRDGICEPAADAIRELHPGIKL